MDLITLVAILALIAAILALNYLLFVGQKSISEWWLERTGRWAKPGPPPTPSIPHNLPPRREFIGRQEAKKALLKALTSPRSYLIAVHGLGGIGKTALALEVAHELLEARMRRLTDQEEAGDVELPDFEAFVWLTSEDRGLTLSEILDTIALTLDYPSILHLPLDEKPQKVSRILQTHRVLVIFDDFELVNDKSVHTFILNLPEPSKVLLTTRFRILPQARPISLTLMAMSVDEALTLIRNESDKLGIPAFLLGDENMLVRLYEATGGVPLALIWALGQIKQRGETLDHVLEYLYGARGELFEFLFRRSWELLSISAQRILIAMTVFASPAKKEAISAVSDVHDAELDKGLAQLVEMGLLNIVGGINEDTRRYGLHPLTRAFAESLLVEQWSIDYQDIRTDLPEVRAFYSQLADIISSLNQRGHSQVRRLSLYFAPFQPNREQS
jgi:hypothetical protein